MTYNSPLADRPLLLLGILLVMVGVQLLSLGIVADLLARTYHESQGKTSYAIRHCLRAEHDGRGENEETRPVERNG